VTAIFGKTNARANRPQPTVPIGIVSATKNVAVLTVVFNQPVRAQCKTRLLIKKLSDGVQENSNDGEEGPKDQENAER
jgi:hypothetical protein